MHRIGFYCLAAPVPIKPAAKIMQELEAAKCDVYIEHTRVTHEKIVKALTKCTSSTSG